MSNDKPDLHVLARKAEFLSGSLHDFHSDIDEAFSAALGKWDEDTDTVIQEGSGDNEDYFAKAKEEVSNARWAVARAQELIATAQGWREFHEAGTVSA